MAAADAQEISQLDGFRALRDGTQQKIWYGDQASNVWNYFSGTYPNYLEPKDRFYGKDIAIDVPIATKATIFPPDQSDGDSESNIKLPRRSLLSNLLAPKRAKWILSPS